ncbi:hypothetical protein [Frigoriflavimonas asaccharolytica]|uniref:Uncharacterized protein n=1 Tax=Frigoriflavimonas asaccharolytica TaxID=2735899 RepID=A0A8J8G9F3_9FLAO|nr:hypothetical protein [Frigoriflavimonas asaccharolytica]NRS93913.1 hypothetical protein [Frigoriflavimonas asaccharolytica]
MQEDSQHHFKYQVAYLNNSEFSKNKVLASTVENISENVFKKSGPMNKNMSVQDSLLEGAVILTSNVLEITEGSKISYTFPIVRNFYTNRVENLVLRKNADNSFSGILMQYNLTTAEKAQYINGSFSDFTGKIDVYKINNLSIAGQSQVAKDWSCWTLVYQANPCTNGAGHAYGHACLPGSNPANAAQPNTLVAVINNCPDLDEPGPPVIPGGGASSGSPGGSPSGGAGGDTAYTPQNPYNTFMLLPFGDANFSCAEGDIVCVEQRAFNAQLQEFFSGHKNNLGILARYNPILKRVGDYLRLNNFSEADKIFLKDRLTLIANWLVQQDNSSPEKELENYRYADWALNYLIISNTSNFSYLQAHPTDFNILYMENIDAAGSDFADASANVILDILINQENGTLSSLDTSWPSLEVLKQQVKQAISYGIYTTAKHARNYLYLPMAKAAAKYPSSIYWSNKAVDRIRIDAVTPLVNFNTNTMQWQDLFNIWLFELTPSNFPYSSVNFTGGANIVSGNNIYNPATNAVSNFPQGNTTGLLNIKQKLSNGLQMFQTATGYFHYDVNAFYSTLSNQNIGIQMLGSYPITAFVISKTGNSALVQFTITNDLGWDSATRFIKGENGLSNQGVIDDKDVGTGIHLGGTITNNFTWTQTITF